MEYVARKFCYSLRLAVERSGLRYPMHYETPSDVAQLVRTHPDSGSIKQRGSPTCEQQSFSNIYIEEEEKEDSNECSSVYEEFLLKYTNIFDDDDDKEDCSSNNSVDESLSLVTDIQTPYQSEAWESGPSTPIYDICSSDLPSIPHVAGIDDTVQHYYYNTKWIDYSSLYALTATSITTPEPQTITVSKLKPDLPRTPPPTESKISLQKSFVSGHHDLMHAVLLRPKTRLQTRAAVSVPIPAAGPVKSEPMSEHLKLGGGPIRRIRRVDRTNRITLQEGIHYEKSDHGKKVFVCLHCERDKVAACNRWNDFRRHFESKHCKIPPYPCKNCGQRFRRSEQLLQHLKAKPACSLFDIREQSLKHRLKHGQRKKL